MRHRYTRHGSIRPLVLAACLLAGTGVARGQDLNLSGVRVPEHTMLYGERLVLNGAGLRKFFGIGVYVAALYFPAPRRHAEGILGHDEPRSMQVTLLRSVSTEQNVEALKGGLEANNSADELAAIAPLVDRFLELLRQVRQVPAGTLVRLDYFPAKGTCVTVGDMTLGTIPGERFNRDMLKIWLGDDPIQMSLKSALLGQRSSS